MELRAIEHAVTHSPSPARSIACGVARDSLPGPGHRPAHCFQCPRCAVFTPVVMCTDRNSELIDRHGRATLCFVTVTHPLLLAEGCYHSQKPGNVHARLAGRGAVHARDQCTVYQHPRAGSVRRTSRCLSRRHGCTARVREHERGPASRPIPGL